MSSTLTSTHDADAAHIIKVLLVDRGLKHSDLAAALGFDAGTMSRALNGKRKWTIEDIKHAADYLDVSVGVLLGDPRDLIKSRCFPHAPAHDINQMQFLLAA